MGAEDRETTIAFTDADEDMQVYTANRKLRNRLKKLGYEAEEEDKLGGFYIVPRAVLQFRKPREFSITEEERAERAERLRSAREAAGIGEYSKKKPKKKAPAKKRRPKPEPEEEDEDEYEDDEDFDDEEEETEVVRPKARKKPSASKTKTRKRKS